MTNFIDTVLNGSPTFKFTYSDNTTAVGVKIELENEIITLGTVLNKALFDSIADDLNSRLLVSNKATNVEAKIGTNDIKYMTPAKVQTKLTSLISHSTETHTGDTRTSYTLINNFGTGQVIDLYALISAGNSSSNYAEVTLSGTGISFHSSVDSLSNASSTSVPLRYYTTAKQVLHLRIDTNSQTITGTAYRLYSSTGTPSVETLVGSYTTITSITASLNSASSIDYTLQFNSKNPNV